LVLNLAVEIAVPSVISEGFNLVVADLDHPA
jgi:hypothetical protein